MWSEQSFFDLRASLQTLIFRSESLLDGLEDPKVQEPTPEEALRSLQGIKEALEGALMAVHWDVNEALLSD